MQLTVRRFFTVLGLGIVAACGPDQAALLTESSLVGEYVYTSAQTTSAPAQDRLVLRSNGTYVITRGENGLTKSTREGAWRLRHATPNQSPVVLLDRDSFPVAVINKEIRLKIDDDEGLWYAKVR